MLIILLIVLAAFLLRAYAVANLPVDFDEPVYLRAAQHYAAALRAGDWDEIRNYAYVREHPPLMKLVYALVIAGQPPAPDLPAELDENYIPPPALIQVGMAARAASALLGTLAVLLIALVNPLAGLALALHTYTIKYTAQIYLEALPMLTSAVAVLAYARAQRQERGRAWWVLSAVALGLTAAAKYVYCVAGLAIVVDYALARRGIPSQCADRLATAVADFGGLGRALPADFLRRQPLFVVGPHQPPAGHAAVPRRLLAGRARPVRRLPILPALHLAVHLGSLASVCDFHAVGWGNGRARPHRSQLHLAEPAHHGHLVGRGAAFLAAVVHQVAAVYPGDYRAGCLLRRGRPGAALGLVPRPSERAGYL
jgi:hypothetical protein